MECNKPMMAYVNPLAFLEIDEPWASVIKSDLTLEGVLRYLTLPDLESNLESIVQRYKQISIENPRVSISPDNSNILKKIIWPLKQAKGSYILGNYIGTISLCGFVSEMIALMVFDITDKKINNQDLDKVLQRELFGSEFEKLGQDRRIEILKVYGIISKETYKLYKEIKDIRRKYIHFWSSKLEGLTSPKTVDTCYTRKLRQGEREWEIQSTQKSSSQKQYVRSPTGIVQCSR